MPEEVGLYEQELSEHFPVSKELSPNSIEFHL